MIYSFIYKVAKEVQAILQNEFGSELTVEMTATPRKTVKELSKISVVVCPRSESFALKARGLCDYQATIEIGIQKKVGSDTEGDIDFVALIAERAAYVISSTAISSAAWISQEIDPIIDAGGLEADGVATSVIRVVYQCVRTK